MFGGKPILIIEDELLIAMSLADAVDDLEGHVIGPLATVSEAMDVLNSVEIAAAILDARLLDRDITPVALWLANAGIPFVVHSATGLPSEVAAEWPDVAVLSKPAPAGDVAQLLLDEMDRRDRLPF